MTLKIAFVTPYYDPRDIRRGSGTFYYMSRELERQGCQVEYFGPIQYSDPFSTRILRFVTKRILGKRYKTYLDPAIAKVLGRELKQELDRVSVDLVLTNDPGVAAGLQVEMPVVYYSDVMISASTRRIDLRKQVAYDQVPIWALRRYQKTMRQCLEHVKLSIFPAGWQNEYALGFGIDPSKVKVLSFGANIEDPGRSTLHERTTKLSTGNNVFTLLFVGRNWIEKGGNIALKTVELLREAGVDAQLLVVGTIIPDPPDYVKVYGDLNKAFAQDAATLDILFRESDCLIFPSRHEGSAITPREAAAYGLPTLAYRIDGILSSVVDGQSGVLLQPGSGPEFFVQVITDWFNQPELYRHLSSGAREFYETKANWSNSVKQLITELHNLLDFDL